MKYSQSISLFFLLATAVACGSSQVGANGNSAANVAAKANEPRTGDPTAAQNANANTNANANAITTTPGGATTGVAATLSGEPPSSSKNPEDPPKAFGSSSSSSSSSSSNAQKNEADLPKKISARHVLVQWMGAQKAASSIVRSRDQALAVAQDVLKRAKKGDDFARLAVEFSDEPGAGNRGGSLGRFGRGTMVPQFDQAAFRLDVGQVSEIIETPFGFHVIQRTE